MITSRRRASLRLCLAGVWLLLALCGARTLCARDVFVMLSGGDSPMENNYSQYLQARAMVNFFERNYPPDSVWVFFGAGNVEGKKPVFGDVRRKVKRDGMLLDTWLPGALPANRPAQRDVILRAFQNEILPAVANGGTLYLFVGDHGSRSSGPEAESTIVLWSLERDLSEHGWRSNDSEVLGVAELRRLLGRGIGKGRVVFCMTQCHAGGFHYLAIPREMTPDPNWFIVTPVWAEAKQEPAFPPIAGFTATDEASPASGCNPDPNPDNWAGYERFVPESLLGLNLMTGARIGPTRLSFAEAHVAATFTDNTIDKPYSTSEQYLERWADLIDTRLVKEPMLSEKAKRALAVYRATVNGAVPKVSDPAFQERQKLFAEYIDNMSAQDPELKTLLAEKRKGLEEVIGPAQSPLTRLWRPHNGPINRGGRARTRRLWTETVRPAWRAAIESNRVAGMSAPALDFEKYLLMLEDRDQDYFFSSSADALQEKAFWKSGYSDPATVNPAKAEAVVRWGVERRAKILAWAKSSGSADVRAAADRLAQNRSRRRSDASAEWQGHTLTDPVDEVTAAERTLFYRRVLAAWQFLIAMDERPALARLKELTALERTPLPPPKQ